MTFPVLVLRMVIDMIAPLSGRLSKRLRNARSSVSAFTWLSAGAGGALCLSVINTLFGLSTAVPVVLFSISLVAVGTLLVGIAAAARGFHSLIAAAIVAVAWVFIAGLSAQSVPLMAGVICLAATAAIVTIGDGLVAKKAQVQKERIEPIIQAEPIILDRQGKLKVACAIETLPLRVGDSLIERVHLTEQVSVLHDLQDIAIGSAQERRRLVMFDVSADNEPARFIDLDIAFAADADKIVLTHCVPVPAEVAETDSTETHKRLLAVASHELRTPLNAIIGFSDVLRAKTFGDFNDPRQEEYVNLIHGAGQDLLSLVNTILDVSKIEAGAYTLHAEPFDIIKTIDETFRLIEVDAVKKGLHVTNRCQSDGADYIADRRAVRQVLTNLLSNAVKFTPDGGCIGVELARTDDGGFALTVTDTGIGLSDSDQARLFRPFVQVDNAYTRQCEGTGLGLALVKGLVDLHGGSLHVESDTDIGTAITAKFPGDVRKTVHIADRKPAQGAPVAAMADLFQRKAI